MNNSLNKEILWHLRIHSFVLLCLITLFICGALFQNTDTAIPPSNHYVFQEKAFMLRDAEKFDELESISRKRIASHPNALSGYWYLGISLEETGRYTEAIKHYEKALEMTNDISEQYSLRRNIESCKNKKNN